MKELAQGCVPWYGDRYSTHQSSLNDLVKTVARLHEKHGEHGRLE